MSVDYGGFIKLDAMFSYFSDGDVASTNGGRDYFRPNSVPVAANAASEDSRGFLDMHAKDTRFFFKIKSHVAEHTVGGYIEMDFRSGEGGNEIATNSFLPRLRRAFFTYDNWLFGQEWTLFRNLEATPENMDDLRGPTQALVIVRQPQVRYTWGDFQFAVENAETNALPRSGGATFVVGDSIAPDLTARYNLKTAESSFSATVLARRLSAEGAATGVPGQVADGSAFGYGVNLAGKVGLFGSDDLRFSVTAGEGIGRYVGIATVADAVVDADGDLEPIRVLAAYATYRHLWNARWRSNLTLGSLQADHDVDLTGTGVTHAVHSAHANLLYSPMTKMTFGLELMHGIRELESGQDGALSRAQFSAKYEF